MTDRLIQLSGDINGDHFKLWYSRKDGKPLSFYLDQIDIEDYDIYKSTANFRKVNIEDLLEFKYSFYLLIKKGFTDNTEKWIELTKGFGMRYLHKPFPPNEVLDRIRILK